MLGEQLPSTHLQNKHFFFLLTKQEGGGGGGGGDIGVIRMGQSKENEYKQTKVAITTENGNMVPWQHELVPASRI